MICEFLKLETRQYHDQAEKALGAVKIFDKNYSKDDYIKLLKILYVAHYDVEKAITTFANHDLIIADHYKNKHDLIKHDLQKMGIKIDNSIKNQFQINNEFQALGCLFVLKGSEMGANLIYKQLSKHFLNQENVCMDFYSFETNIFNIWGDFCTSLDSYFLSKTDKENYETKKLEVLEGAKKTYLYFIQSSL